MAGKQLFCELIWFFFFSIYVDLLFSYFLFRLFADTKIFSVILFDTHLCSLCLLSGIFSFTHRLFYSHSSPLFVWLPSIGWFLALMLFFAYSSLCSFSRSVSVRDCVQKSFLLLVMTSSSIILWLILIETSPSLFFFCTSSQTAVTTTNKCYNSNNTTTAPASGQQQAGNSNNNNNNGNSIYTRFTSSIKYAAAAAVVFSFNYTLHAFRHTFGSLPLPHSDTYLVLIVVYTTNVYYLLDR